jgi:hypothetical protein
MTGVADEDLIDTRLILEDKLLESRGFLGALNPNYIDRRLPFSNEALTRP